MVSKTTSMAKLHRCSKGIPFFRYFWNTSFLAILNVVGTLFSASLVAYSFSKLRWKGRNQLFYITIATMFIPSQVLIIPTYLLFSKLGWVNTYLPLVVPAFCGGGAFNIFLLRQFFVSIPDELLEAARIDGASEFRIYSQIMLPLSKPVLFTVSIFTLLFHGMTFLDHYFTCTIQKNGLLQLG